MLHFSWPIDGGIVGLYLLATMIAGISVRKYVGKVEHFLVAGRKMAVYLCIERVGHQTRACAVAGFENGAGTSGRSLIASHCRAASRR
jgi:hypothetical protein